MSEASTGRDGGGAAFATTSVVKDGSSSDVDADARWRGMVIWTSTRAMV